MYLYSRQVRQSAQIGKMVTAAEKLSPFLAASKLFTAAIVDNECKIFTSTPIMPHSQTLEYSHGTAKDCAIAFRHIWTRHPEGYISYVTDGSPWILVVSLDGVLRAHYGKSSIQFQLATSVTNVEAITGWYNLNNEAEDQGIVVVYRKADGYLYLRNYVQLGNGEKAWLSEQSLSHLGVVKEFSLFRANDYRMGIVYTDMQNNIQYCMSKRVYTGVYLPVETFETNAFLDVKEETTQINVTKKNTLSDYMQTTTSVDVEPYVIDLSPAAVQTLEDLPPVEGDVVSNKIKLRFNRRMYIVPGTLPFTVVDNNNVSFVVTAATVNPNNTFEVILTTASFNNYVGALTVGYTGTGNVLQTAGVSPVIGALSFSRSFVPQYAMPVETNPPVPTIIQTVTDSVMEVIFDKPLLDQQSTTAYQGMSATGTEYTNGRLPLKNVVYTPTASYFKKGAVVSNITPTLPGTNVEVVNNVITLAKEV